jgi:hypothetical protein
VHTFSHKEFFKTVFQGGDDAADEEINRKKQEKEEW